MEVVGAPYNLLLLEVIRTEEPAYDARVETLERSIAPDIENGTITESWTVVSKTNAQIIEEIRALEYEKNSLLLDSRLAEKLSILGIGLMMRQVGDTGLNNVEKQIRRRMIALSTKVYTNETNKRALIDAVNAGNPYDISAGWEDIE